MTRLYESRQCLDGPAPAGQPGTGERASVAVIEQTAVTLRKLLSAAPAEVLHSPMPGHPRTVTLTAAHLYDVDLAFGYNVRMALTEPNPRYVNYHEPRWALLPRPPLWQMINAWESLRADNLILVRHLVHAEGSRDGAGAHNEAGHLVCELAAHDLGHIAAIERALAYDRTK